MLAKDSCCFSGFYSFTKGVNKWNFDGYLVSLKGFHKKIKLNCILSVLFSDMGSSHTQPLTRQAASRLLFPSALKFSLLCLTFFTQLSLGELSNFSSIFLPESSRLFFPAYLTAAIIKQERNDFKRHFRSLERKTGAVLNVRVIHCKRNKFHQ